MRLNRILYDRFLEKSRSVLVENVTIGLGYTAVTVSDGGMGLAGTWFAGGRPESMNRDYVDFEGLPASELLKNILDGRVVHRCMALALINALNYSHAAAMTESLGNRFLMETMGVGSQSRVAMVGYSRPMAEMIRGERIRLEILDTSLGMGEQDAFYDRLSGWADALILTSTSMINNTTEEILGHTAGTVKTMMIGPSTPMVEDVFQHLQVDLLAGAAPVDREMVLKAVRHGTGTPVIRKYCRQVYCKSMDL